MDPRWKIGRVIARPFIKNKDGSYTRTSSRHDFALKPPAITVLDNLKNNNYDVIGIGKIADIFANQGITKDIKTINNIDTINRAIEMQKQISTVCVLLILLILIQFMDTVAIQLDMAKPLKNLIYN